MCCRMMDGKLDTVIELLQRSSVLEDLTLSGLQLRICDASNRKFAARVSGTIAGGAPLPNEGDATGVDGRSDDRHHISLYDL